MRDMIAITYFVHGTTTDNEQHLATGWLPGELSALGRQQTVELGEHITGRKFDAVFASDLARAVESARLMFDEKQAIIQDKRLREANYGDWNGKPHTFKDNMDDFVDEPFPGGESYRDVEKRMREFCDYLKQNYDGKHVAIVAHQAPQLALDVILKSKTWAQAIAEDWRKRKAYQPGWEYQIS
jgi:broad specificity phosphatase PhoE